MYLVILVPRGFAPRTPLQRRSRAPRFAARSAPLAHSRRSFASSWFREASPVGLPYTLCRYRRSRTIVGDEQQFRQRLAREDAFQLHVERRPPIDDAGV